MTQTIDQLGYLSWALWRYNPQHKPGERSVFLQPVMDYSAGDTLPRQGFLLSFFLQPFELCDFRITNADYVQWERGKIVPGQVLRDRNPISADQLTIPDEYQELCRIISQADDICALSCQLAPNTTYSGWPAFLLEIFYCPRDRSNFCARTPDEILLNFATRIRVALEQVQSQGEVR